MNPFNTLDILDKWIVKATHLGTKNALRPSIILVLFIIIIIKYFLK